MKSTWDDDKVCARVKALWANNSASVIAGVLWTEFRITVTRNAVVGYLHRQKLTVEQKSEVHPKTRSHGINRPKAPRPARKAPFMQIPVIAGTPLPSDFVDIVVDPLNITFADIGDGQCRSIVNSDTSAPLYCGHFTDKGHHYCKSHRSLYYVPGKRKGSLYPEQFGKHHGGVFGRVA